MEQTTSPASRIPVTIITGFLGFGKTTVLNALLRDPAFSGTAVLINEFGDVQIDHDLVADFTDELVMTTTGCMCCTASSDIKQSLYELWDKRQKGASEPFSRVLVETTGLMDPVPVVNSLLVSDGSGIVEQTVSERFALSRVITLFDIVFGPMTLDQHDEAAKQVALADVLLLTKTDLAQDPATRRDVVQDKQRLASINQGALILDRHADWSDLTALILQPGSYDLRNKSEDVIAWLDSENSHGHGHHAHDHAHHHHQDTTRHGDNIRSHVIVHDGLISPKSFHGFLEYLKENAGTDLLRIKGLFGLSDAPERPIVVHGVQHAIYPTERLASWPGEDKRTKIVLIGRDLDASAFRSVLASS